MSKISLCGFLSFDMLHFHYIKGVSLRRERNKHKRKQSKTRSEGLLFSSQMQGILGKIKRGQGMQGDLEKSQFEKGGGSIQRLKLESENNLCCSTNLKAMAVCIGLLTVSLISFGVRFSYRTRACKQVLSAISGLDSIEERGNAAANWN